MILVAACSASYRCIAESYIDGPCSRTDLLTDIIPALCRLGFGKELVANWRLCCLPLLLYLSNLSFIFIMVSIGASDIIKLGQTALLLWDLGFSKAKNAGLYTSAVFFGGSLPIKHGTASTVIPIIASRTLANSEWSCSAKQDAEFGADIRHFGNNLLKLGEVIGDVTKQVPASLSHTWDLKSVLQICGDFRKTLKECERLLNDPGKFERGRDNFIYNIRWNLSVEPQVARLRDRVAFHNIKVTISLWTHFSVFQINALQITTILKPLEL